MDTTSNLINIGIKKLQCCVAVQGVGAASRFEGKGYEAAHGLAGLGNIHYTQYIIHNTQYTIHNRIHNRVHNTQKSIDKLLFIAPKASAEGACILAEMGFCY